jgi:hypothetical protein
LEKIETLAAPILRRIVNSSSVAWLTEKQRNKVGDFIAAQSFRTEAFYQGMELGLSRQEFGTVFCAALAKHFGCQPISSAGNGPLLQLTMMTYSTWATTL